MSNYLFGNALLITLITDIPFIPKLCAYLICITQEIYLQHEEIICGTIVEAT